MCLQWFIEDHIAGDVKAYAEFGVRCRMALVNPVALWKMARRLNARMEARPTEAGIVEWLKLYTAAGEIAVETDPDCPEDHWEML